MKTVFGDPIQVGGRTIIPVASVSVSGGGGGGSGKDNQTKAKGKGLGWGGGAGMHIESKPIGYIEITEEGAKFVPTMDQTKIAMRGMLSGIVSVGMFCLAGVFGALRKKQK